MTKPSPEEFFAGEKPREKCFLCRSSLRTDMERAQAAGVTYASLTRWVAAVHPEVRMGATTIHHHFAERHHDRNANS